MALDLLLVARRRHSSTCRRRDPLMRTATGPVATKEDSLSHSVSLRTVSDGVIISVQGRVPLNSVFAA